MPKRNCADNAEIDYIAFGCKDGECIYGEFRKTEEHRRKVVLRAASQLRGDPEHIAKYLDGLELGMQNAGAVHATAQRLRYEVAAIISAYAIAVGGESPQSKASLPNGWTTPDVSARKELESQATWQNLVNVARRIRSAAFDSGVQGAGLSKVLRRGNRTVREFDAQRFEQLREELIKRTGARQALELLSTAIATVSNAYAGVVADEIEVIKRAERRICEKVSASNASSVRQIRFG